MRMTITRFALVLLCSALPLLIGCGSGGESGSGSVAVGGGAVKGPLAFAAVSIFALDPNAEDSKGALLGSGETDGSAEIVGLTIPANVEGYALVEFAAVAATVDLSSGTPPIYDRLITFVALQRLLDGESVYATPLTTMAIGIAQTRADQGLPYLGNGDDEIDEAEFIAALEIAQGQTKATLGFGLDQAINIFETPPLITEETDTPAEQLQVALYRQASEALAAVTMFVADDSSADDDPQMIFEALIEDLSDGEIDGEGPEGAVAALVALDESIEDTLLIIDPGALMIPGTDIPVDEIETILLEETSETNVETDTSALDDGTIEVEAGDAELVSDIDADGVPDDEDAFPEDPEETIDSDEDGVGDNGDAFPLDPTESRDSDEDLVGDNADVFPFDPTESADTDSDGVGDNGDAFPEDPTETSDQDEDGVGDNRDAFPTDPTRSEVTGFDANLWIGAEDTEVFFSDGTGLTTEYFRFTNADCDVANYANCDEGRLDVLNGEPILDLTSRIDRDTYHQFENQDRVVRHEVGIDRWVKRYGFGITSFNDQMWVIGGLDGIADGESGDQNEGGDNGGGDSGDFDGFRANDAWSSRDGDTWVQVTNDAPFTARLDHAVAAFNGKLWVIGGSDVDESFLNDVWSSPDGLNWTRVTANAPFEARQQHRLVVHDEKMWLIGGTGTGFQYLNDVWSTEDGINWTQVTSNADFPALGYVGAVAFQEEIWIAGGGGLYTGVWHSADGITWTQELEANFPARNVYGIAVHDNKIWISGGFSDGYLNDTWFSDDGITYTQVPATTDNFYFRRSRPGMLSFEGRLWLMGGRGTTSKGDVRSTSDGTFWKWHSFGAASIPQRIRHTFTEFQGALYSLGGTTYGSDSSIWRTADGASWERTAEAAPFGNRSELATFVLNDKLWVAGGRGLPEIQSDVWSTADGVSWTQETAAADFAARSGHAITMWNGSAWLVAGADSTNTQLSDVWSSSDGVNWTQATADAGFPARIGHNLVVFQNRLWVLGGSDRNDAWSSADGINWTQENDLPPLSISESYESVVYESKIFLVIGASSRSRSPEMKVWSTSDGIQWVLETEDAGIPNRLGSKLVSFAGDMWMHGGSYSDGLAFIQKDLWRSTDGINWRVGYQATVEFPVIETDLP